jgi:hypothetical protein
MCDTGIVLRLIWASAPALLLFGCGHGEESTFLGNAALAPEIEIVPLNTAGQIERTGDRLPLIEPSQGGRVAFVAVRAKNVDRRGLMVRTSLWDPCSGKVLSLERRELTLQTAPDGWAEPER